MDRWLSSRAKSTDLEIDFDVASGRIAVRAYLMGRFYHCLGLLSVHARDHDFQLDGKTEGTTVQGPERDPRVDGRAGRVDAESAADNPHRALKAGSVAQREKLLGVGGASGATELLRRPDVEIEYAVRRSTVSVAATLDRRLGRIQTFFQCRAHKVGNSDAQSVIPRTGLG